MGVEHEQTVQEVALDLLGASAAVLDGEARQWANGFLGNRTLSIAGGISDIQRNIVAERLLGLPKDPCFGPRNSDQNCKVSTASGRHQLVHDAGD